MSAAPVARWSSMRALNKARWLRSGTLILLASSGAAAWRIDPGRVCNRIQLEDGSADNFQASCERSGRQPTTGNEACPKSGMLVSGSAGV
jgi:hypothetical protein